MESAVFQNISASEQAHFNAIETLLSRYGADDPALTTAAGVYSDPKLIALYNELLAKGLRSAPDALEVGVLIEKQDITDLQAALTGTGKLDIKRVYTTCSTALSTTWKPSRQSAVLPTRLPW